jgi:hypothetical protein
MPLITYQGQPVAMAGPRRAFIVPIIANRPDHDPLRQFVCHLILYAREARAGRLAGEPNRYLPDRAERYVRALLIPAALFHHVRELPDHQLAESFGVPIEQIAERRGELLGQLGATGSRADLRRLQRLVERPCDAFGD